MMSATDRVIRRGAVAVAVASVLVVVLTAVAAVTPGARNWLRAAMGWAPAGFVAGSAAQLPPSLYEDAAVTVLLFVRSNCDACRQSQAFHQQLAQVFRNIAGVRIRVLVTSPDDDPSAYATALHLPSSAALRFDARSSLVRRVPTLLVVTRDGIVREMKEGVLSETDQHALIQQITRISRPTG